MKQLQVLSKGNGIINIPVYKTSEGECVVYGRELQEGLEIKSNYTTWFKRMCEYGFEENTDYITCLPKMASESHGGQNKQDHIIKLDMAKEMAMIQRNEKGKQARKYFLACEKQLKQPALPTTYKEALQQLLIQVETNEQQQKQLEQQKPIVNAYKSFLDVADNMDFETLGKHLGIGRNKLMAQLREWKVLQDGVMTYQGQEWKSEKHNVPYQKYMDKGFFVLKQVKIPNGQFKTKTFVTPLGATAIAKKLELNNL